MSGSKLKTPALTDQQRAWANAFLELMGGQTQQRGPAPKGRQPRPQLDQLQGSLGRLEGQVTQREQEARRQLSGEGEQISRGKLIGSSKDKGFQQNVAEEVDRFIAEVDRLVGDGASFVMLPQATTLRAQLSRQLTHYQKAGTKKDSREKTEQRARKVQAIQNRLDALDKFVTESSALGQERMAKVVMMMPEEQAQALTENPDVRRGVIAGKPDPAQFAELLDKLPNNDNSRDAFVDDIVALAGDDPEYIDALSKALAKREGNVQQRQAFFRGGEMTVKLMKKFCMTSEPVQELTGSVDKQGRKWVQSVGRVEFDENFLRDKEKGDRDGIIARSVEKVGAFISSLLEDVYSREVAPELKSTSKVVAQEFRDRFPDAQPNEIAIKVAGYVVLRIVAPTLGEIVTELSNEMGKLEKKGKQKSKDYAKLEDQKRAMTFAAKVLQNIAKGILPSTKEHFMAPLDGFIQDSIARMQQYCQEVIA